MSRADGIHFGTGEEADSGIFRILAPDAPCVLNEPEAQHHYAVIAARRPDGLNVWRASPEARPAPRWDAHAFSREVFRNLDAHRDRTGVYPSDVLLLNELNLDYERGDAKGDGGAFDTNPSNWPQLYRLLGRFMEDLLLACRERAGDRGFMPRWWYPGWAPGHGELTPEIAALWVPGAKRFDGIVMHTYTTVEQVTQDVLWYDATFPGHPILIGEWNSINFTGDRLWEEAKIRARLRSMCRDIPRLHACYFIYAWAEDRSHEHDIRGNDGRLALWDGRRSLPEDDWQHPNGSTVEEPAVVDPPSEPPGPAPGPDPWQWFSSEQIAGVTNCPLENVVTNWPKIVSQLAHAGINRRTMQRAVLPTVAIETAHTFQPVEEAFWMSREWRMANLRYAPYWGRGFNQRTWLDGYAAAGPAIAQLWDTDPGQPEFDLVTNPDVLLDPDFAAADLAVFWRDKRADPGPLYPEGYTLQQAADAGDTEWIRKLVQGGSAGLTEFRGMYALLGGELVDPPVVIVPNPGQYDRTYPTIAQNDNWSCWPTSLRWLLAAIGADADGDGQPPTEAYVESQAIRDGIVSTSDGLLVATAGPASQWANDQWLTAMGLQAVARQNITYTEAVHLAIMGGLLVGGNAWNHWSAVRGIKADGTLLLANPALTHQGVGDELDEAEWARWGPWNAISVDIKSQEDPAVIAELQAQVALLTTERDGYHRERDDLIVGLSVAADDLAGAILTGMQGIQEIATAAAGVAEDIQTIRRERVGPPAGVA